MFFGPFFLFLSVITLLPHNLKQSVPQTVSAYSGAYICPGASYHNTYSYAENHCVHIYDTDLATITNDYENEFVRDAANAAGIDSKSLIWIGLSDMISEGEWMWLDGTLFNYSNWHASAPLAGIGDNAEDCVGLWANQNDKWNDYFCDTFYLPFVCNCDEYISVVGLNLDLSWNDAEAYCQVTHGTSLASIFDSSDNVCAYQTAFQMAISNSDSINNTYYVWIGVYLDYFDASDINATIWRDAESGNIIDYSDYFDINTIDFNEIENGLLQGISYCAMFEINFNENENENDNKYKWSVGNCDEMQSFVCNTPSPDYTNITYEYYGIGPYVDTFDRNLRYGPQGESGYTNDTCYLACFENYKYFSIQFGSQCYCDNDFERATRDGPGECGKNGGSFCNYIYGVGVAPTVVACDTPTMVPSNDPSNDPTNNPTFEPSENPTFKPTKNPSHNPTEIPSFEPTNIPITDTPTHVPSYMPTKIPSIDPTEFEFEDTFSTSTNTFETTNNNIDTTNTLNVIDTTFDTTFETTNYETSETTKDTFFEFETEEPTKEPTEEPTEESTEESNEDSLDITIISDSNIDSIENENENDNDNEDKCWFDRKKCNSNPCSCDEVENCRYRSCVDYEGCSQCYSSYWKYDVDYHCIPCWTSFTGCQRCEDFTGCATCRWGYERYFDTDCNVWACKK